MTHVASLVVLAIALSSPGAQEEGKAPPVPATSVRDPVREKALQLDPRSLPAAAAGRWKDWFRDPVRPEDVPAGVRDAMSFLREGDPTLALAALQRVLQAEPDYPPALHEAGVMYFRLQRYGDAIVLVERYLAHLPDRAADTRVLGHCYYSLGDYPRARERYLAVIAAAPEDVEALRGLALSEMRLGHPTQALELLGSVLQKRPEFSEAWAWKARILIDEERPTEALEAASRARDLEPWEPRPWFLVSQALLDLGKEDEGALAQARYRELNAAAQQARSLESRLRFDPHQLPLLEQLVEIRRTTGNLPGTREALARMARERPTDVDIRIRVLDVLESMGDADGARVAAKALEQTCREEWKAWKRLEAYFARMRDRQKQIEAGERYRRLKPD